MTKVSKNRETSVTELLKYFTLFTHWILELFSSDQNVK